MVDVPLLWHSGARKEAMELLRTIWTQADPQMREALGNAICAGPPADLLARIDADEREKSRDRRIFDRLTVLQRLEHPPLTAVLALEPRCRWGYLGGGDCMQRTSPLTRGTLGRPIEGGIRHRNEPFDI